MFVVAELRTLGWASAARGVVSVGHEGPALSGAAGLERLVGVVLFGGCAGLGSGPRDSWPAVWEFRRRNRDSRGDLPEEFEFTGTQGANLADAQALQSDRSDGDPGQRHHLVAELGEHPADLAILAFGEHHFEDAGLSLLADDPHSLGPDLAFGQPDSLGELIKDLAVGETGDDHSVDLLDAKLGMGELVGEVAVVGQEDQACALLVESADGVNSLRDLGKQVDHKRLTGGIVVAGDVSLGLVHGVIDVAFELDLLAVDMDRRLRRVDLDAEFLGDFAVDRDASLGDQFLASASRPKPSLGKDFLQAVGPFGSVVLTRGDARLIALGLKRRTIGGPVVRPIRAVGTIRALLGSMRAGIAAWPGTKRSSWRRIIPLSGGRATV